MSSTKPQVCVGFAASVREGSRTQPLISHVHSCRCEDPSRRRNSGHNATEDWPGKLGIFGSCKEFQVPVAVAKVKNVDRCTSVADWGQGSTSVTADADEG